MKDQPRGRKGTRSFRRCVSLINCISICSFSYLSNYMVTLPASQGPSLLQAQPFLVDANFLTHGWESSSSSQPPMSSSVHLRNRELRPKATRAMNASNLALTSSSRLPRHLQPPAPSLCTILSSWVPLQSVGQGCRKTIPLLRRRLCLWVCLPLLRLQQ